MLPRSAAPIVIAPARRWAMRVNLRELWDYRDLLLFLAWRDVSVRYKQTVLGAAWAVLQPFFSMLVFSLFFGRLGHMPSDQVPYPLFCFAALLPWQYFSTATTQASNSLVGSSTLLTKVFFPRLVIPLASVLPPLVDMAAGLVMLLGLMLWYGLPLTWNVLWLPALVVLTCAAALGLGTWLAAVNVEYRDARHAVPFLLQLAMFASPVVYPASMVPKAWQVWYGLNPMTGAIEGFRWCMLGTRTVPASLMTLSAVVAAVMLTSSFWYFQRMERTFADVV